MSTPNPTTMAAPAELRSRLAEWLAPRLACKSVQVTQLSSPAQGFSNQTLFAHAVFIGQGREQQAELVLRLPPSGEGLFPHYDLDLQFRCMEQLAALGLPAPPLIGYESSCEPFGAPFYVMKRVDGQVPAENPLYSTAGWLFEASPRMQRQHWTAAIGLLGRIARVDPAQFSFLPAPRHGFTRLGEQTESYREFLRWIEVRSQPYPHLHGALAWLDANRPREQPEGLCWGDAKLGNCIFHDGRLVAALDWESAHLDDPVDDLAWWLVLDRSLSEGYGVPRLPGFPARDETVELWEQASGRSARNLAYYEVLCAFKFAVIMARIGGLYLQRGLVPEAHRFDVRNGGSAVLASLGAAHGF